MLYAPYGDHVLFFCFVLVGIGYLFPFSAMTQPVDYWKLLFPSFNILFYISAVFMTSNLFLLSILIYFSRENSTSMLTLKVTIGFFGQFLSLMAIPLSYHLHLDETGNRNLILICTSLMAMSTACIDASILAIVSCFPVFCSEALQIGVGLSTLIGSVYRVLSKLLFPQSSDGILQSSFVYFYAGAGTLMLCLLAFWLMLQLPRSRNCLYKAAKEGTVTDSEAFLDHSVGSDMELDLVPIDRMSVYLKSLKCGISVSLIFIVSISVWPSIISEIPSFNFPWLNVESQWWPLILLNVFAVTDVVGRLMVRLPFGCSPTVMLYLSVLRCILVPIIVLTAKLMLLKHDALSILLVVILGWSNGYMGSLSVSQMIQCSESAQESRFIGTLTSLHINVGLVMGAALALLFNVTLFSAH